MAPPALLIFSKVPHSGLLWDHNQHWYYKMDPHKWKRGQPCGSGGLLSWSDRLCSVLLSSSSEGDKPLSSMVGGVEGDTITPSCSYTGSVNNLQWCNQYPRSKPEFLILITKSGFVQKLVNPRLPAQVHTDRVDLENSSTEVRDSVL